MKRLLILGTSAALFFTGCGDRAEQQTAAPEATVITPDAAAQAPATLSTEIDQTSTGIEEASDKVDSLLADF